MEKNPTDGRDKPNKDVVIVDCGGEEVRFFLLIRVEQFLHFFEGIILAFSKNYTQPLNSLLLFSGCRAICSRKGGCHRVILKRPFVNHLLLFRKWESCEVIS